MADFEALREQTIAATPEGISRELLGAMPQLVAHPGPDVAQAALYYQDRELGGAICATAVEAWLLYTAAVCCRPQLALEIGSYVGWTAAHIARGMADGTLLCVDDFTECNDGPRQMVRLAANLDRAGVSDRVRIVMGHSPEILYAAVHDLVGLAFVDGCHEGDQPLRDVKAVAEVMAPDGVMALHDTWMPGVRRACDWLSWNGWTKMVFPTPARLAFFYRQMPDWWASFMERAHG